MEAGIQHNLGKEWGLPLWKQMTRSSPSKVYSDAMQRSAKKNSKEKEGKAKDEVKQQRRIKKYSKKDDSTQARQAYSRHDGGILPNKVNNDISPEHIDELKQGFYQTKVVVTPREVTQIEDVTRQQAGCPEWLIERRKRIMASMVGGIAKMRSTTKRAKKVENLLYNNKFRGNAATQYGKAKEEIAKRENLTYQLHHGHPGFTVDSNGLSIALDDPWLAASPGGLVNDPSDTSHPLGLVEIKKNTFSTKSDFNRSIQKIHILLRTQQRQQFISTENTSRLILPNTDTIVLYRKTLVRFCTKDGSRSSH